MLSLAHFVAHQYHGHAAAQHQQATRILRLSQAQRVYRLIAGLTFSATVPAVVVVGAITVVLAVRLVMFIVVREQIPQRESIMTGNEIDAGAGTAVIIKVRRSLNAR